MAMTIVGNPDAVVGGVDTHADVHVAAVVNHLGGVLGVESFTTTSHGYPQLVSWLRSHGELVLVGVEGTGSYGVGVSRYLQREGVTVVEVDRPNRQTRHRQGKSDPVDALAAARAALSGSATGSPKTRDGNVEAIRVLMIARRSAVDTRIETLDQLRHVVFTADGTSGRGLARLQGCQTDSWFMTCVTLRPALRSRLARRSRLCSGCSDTPRPTGRSSKRTWRSSRRCPLP
jgi:transposase